MKILDKFFKENLFFCLLLILVVSFSFRFYRLGDFPDELNVDEVSIGYNAYSILMTARDENGIFLPFSFRSYGDYKPSGYIYASVIPIALFGLSPFSVRFTSAFIGSVAPLFLFLLIFLLFRRMDYAIFSSLYLAISPWHIVYSRIASEAQVALSLFVLGFISFLFFVRKPTLIFSFFSAFLMASSMYFYHSNKLFIPLFMLFFFLVNQECIKKIGRNIAFFLIFFLVFFFPIVWNFLFSSDSARASAELINKDFFLTNKVLLNGLSLDQFGFSNFVLTLLVVIRKIFSFLDPGFLFLKGLNLTRGNTLGLGVLYIFQIPLLLLGLYRFFYKHKQWFVMVLWFVIGALPASISIGEHNSIRSLLICPVFCFLLAVGTVDLLRIFARASSGFRFVSLSIFVILVLWNFVHSYFVYFVYFPYQRGEDYMLGIRQAVTFAWDNYLNYEKIVFDPRRGIASPHIVSVPHEYFLFYSKFDPSEFQVADKIYSEDFFSFDKLVFKNIDLASDNFGPRTLLIGSPWSLPIESNDKVRILEKIYLRDGNLALIIAETRY